MTRVHKNVCVFMTYGKKKFCTSLQPKPIFKGYKNKLNIKWQKIR